MSPEEIASKLGLIAHEEGGYFRQTFQTDLTIELSDRKGSTRPVLNTIYYLLTAKSPINYLHRNRSAIAHYFHLGSPLEYFVVSPDGRLETHVLGPDIAGGHQLQLVVPEGCWKAARLLGEGYALISEAVAPGWDVRDRDLATPALLREWPALSDRLAPLVLSEH
jgi:predicted cupin superfamily sugar epimerase